MTNKYFVNHVIFPKVFNILMLYVGCFYSFVENTVYDHLYIYNYYYYLPLNSIDPA